MQKVCVLHLITIIYFVQCYSQNNSDEYDNDYSQADDVINSESNEIFNISLKQKPERIKVNVNINTTEMRKGDNATTDDCNDRHYRNIEESDEQRRCKSTLVNYPFSVSIQKKSAHYTSGALVDKRWILTVAAQFYNVRESIKLYRARLGSVDCKRGGTLIPLKTLNIHPQYVHGKPSYDLALLRMALPVDYTNFIRPIGLSKIRARVLSAKFLVTYWPRLILNGKVLPESAQERLKYNSMRVSTQRLIPWDRCYKLMHTRGETLDVSSLCLKPISSHHSACMPDVGAPVVAEDGLWGITSGWTSEDCSTVPSPTIFTRISSQPIRSWLDAKLLEI